MEKNISIQTANIPKQVAFLMIEVEYKKKGCFIKMSKVDYFIFVIQMRGSNREPFISHV